MKAQKNSGVKFNIVDALIILFILTVLALTVYVFILGHDLAELYSTEEQITYTVCIQDNDMTLKSSVSVNDVVYHWNKKENTGTVTDVRTEKDNDGKEANLYITVSATARKINSSYYINGKKIEKDAFIDISFAKVDIPEAVKCVSVQAN